MAANDKGGIADEVLNQLLQVRDPAKVFETGGLVDEPKKRLAERMLNGEMKHHLDTAVKEEAANHCNAYGAKTVVTDTGKLELTIPPRSSWALIGKYRRRCRLRRRNHPLYARGMTTREIAALTIARCYLAFGLRWDFLVARASDPNKPAARSACTLSHEERSRPAREAAFVRAFFWSAVTRILRVSSLRSPLGFRGLINKFPSAEGRIRRAAFLRSNFCLHSFTGVPRFSCSVTVLFRNNYDPKLKVIFGLYGGVPFRRRFATGEQLKFFISARFH